MLWWIAYAFSVLYMRLCYVDCNLVLSALFLFYIGMARRRNNRRWEKCFVDFCNSCSELICQPRAAVRILSKHEAQREVMFRIKYCRFILKGFFAWFQTFVCANCVHITRIESTIRTLLERPQGLLPMSKLLPLT